MFRREVIEGLCFMSDDFGIEVELSAAFVRGKRWRHIRDRYLLLRSYLRRRKEDRVERWHESSLVRNQVSLLAQPKRQNPSMVAASRSRLGISYSQRGRGA